MQLDDSLRVRVRDAVDLVAYLHASAELLGDLAFEARSQCFSAVALTAWELPIAFEVRAAQAPGYEVAVRGGE